MRKDPLHIQSWLKWEVVEENDMAASGGTSMIDRNMEHHNDQIILKNTTLTFVS